MNKASRRALARYAADQLLAGTPVRQVARQLAAAAYEFGYQEQAQFLLDDINWELERRGALVVGRLTTATPLTEELKKAFRDYLKQVTSTKEVLLETHVDKSVIGGVRIETAGRVWDHSIERKLTELREVF